MPTRALVASAVAGVAILGAAAAAVALQLRRLFQPDVRITDPENPSLEDTGNGSAASVLVKD